MSILVIGYGNTLRCDDGAGVALAERLAECWRRCGVAVQLLTVTQLVPELCFDVAAECVRTVVFVDARAGQAGEGVQIRRIEPETTSPSLGHQLDPAALLLYARLIAKRTLPAWLVTVPGVDFAHGERLSLVVLRLLASTEQIVDQLQHEFEEVFCAHELSIAQTLIDTARVALPELAGAQVTEVTVQLGRLAGLSSEELAFGFQMVAPGTPFAGAHLKIEEVPALIHCLHCQQDFGLEDPLDLCCPVCGTTRIRIVHGKELILRAIEVSDGSEHR